MAIRFIHTADLHFGVENYGKIDSKTGIHTRLLDFTKAFNYVIDYAISNSVDFFLFAGDAYKTAYPTPTQQRLLIKCLLRLHKENIPVVIVPGNHDNPLSFGKAHALDLFDQFPLEGFHVISKPAQILLKTKNGPVQIVGIPWPTRHNLALNFQHVNSSNCQITEYISASVCKIIQQLAAELDPHLPAVLCGHLTVSSGIFSGSEKKAVYGTDPLFLPSELAIKPFDYVALGHLHRFQNLNSKNGIPIIYSGSIERIDFGERKEDKGFCYATIENKNSTTYEFIKTPVRPLLQIEAKLVEGKDQTEQVINEISKHDIKDAIIKIIYYLPIGKKDQVNLNSIQEACSHAHYIVSIIPVRLSENPQKRLTLNSNMDLAKLLDNYFDLKPEFKESKITLIKKALELELELELYHKENEAKINL